MTDKDLGTTVALSSKEGSPSRQEFKSESPKDALGSFGTFLTSAHVGDLTGIAGLVITIIAAWQATSAKNAARAAASAAISQRDRIEIASRLTDLSNRLKIARDVYHSSDWSRLPHLQDEIVSISSEIKATEKEDTLLVELMENIKIFARKGPIDLRNFKDDETILKTKHRQAKAAIDWADKVDAEKSRKVKNGT